MDVRIDHLIVAGPDLAEAVEYVERIVGEVSVPGGQHPGVGTRNALIGLRPGAYIEIIGPDPSQPEPEQPRWFGIDTLTGPRLAAWSARTPDLSKAIEAANTAGVDLGEVSHGGRVRTDGVRLDWSVTDPRADRFDGVLPFLMDWMESEHPSRTLGTRSELMTLRGRHPDGAAVRLAAEALALPIEIVVGPTPGLEAEIRTPDGLVTLS